MHGQIHIPNVLFPAQARPLNVRLIYPLAKCLPAHLDGWMIGILKLTCLPSFDLPFPKPLSDSPLPSQPTSGNGSTIHSAVIQARNVAVILDPNFLFLTLHTQFIEALYLNPLSGLSRCMSHLDSAIFCPPCCPHKHHPFLKVQIIFPGRDGTVGIWDKRKREQNPGWVHVMAIGQFTPQLPTGATLKSGTPNFQGGV